MTIQELVEKFSKNGVHLSDYNGEPCLVVDGWLTDYAILLKDHAPYDMETGRWISIVQSSTGSHKVDNLLSLVPALLNDIKMCEYIPTLKNKRYYELQQSKQTKMTTKIEDVLLDAINDCTPTIEEEGGVILYNKKTDLYKYCKLRNSNTGTSVAPVLWTADRDEYAKLVIPAYKDGWQHYASFHTHPQFMPLPSGIDYNVLFPGFPVNYIYSPVTQEITQWNVDTDNTSFNRAGTFMYSTTLKLVKQVQ